MSVDSSKNDSQERPGNLDKREALKRIGRYAAYTAPATLVALGYATSQAGEEIPISNGGSPPPPPFLPPPPTPE